MLNYATNPFVVNDWSQPVNSGDVGALSNTVTSIQRDLRNLKSMISFDSKTVLCDNLKSYTAGGNISVLSPLVMSNSASLTINGQLVRGGAGSSVGSNLYVSSLGAGSLVVDGDITYGGNLIHTSDRRLKEDIRPLELDCDRVLAGLNPVRFRWGDGREDIGLLAQDVAAVCPECVSVGAGGVLGVDYAKLVVVLLGILKGKIG